MRQGPIALFRLGHEIPVRWPTWGKANESSHQAQSIREMGSWQRRTINGANSLAKQGRCVLAFAKGVTG